VFGHAIALLLGGGVAALAGGDEGWRWVFILFGIVGLPLALSAITIKEPRRSRHEMLSALGEEFRRGHWRAADLALGRGSSACARSAASTSSSPAWPPSEVDQTQPATPTVLSPDTAHVLAAGTASS
jgi:MFS family permease